MQGSSLKIVITLFLMVALVFSGGCHLVVQSSGESLGEVDWFALPADEKPLFLQRLTKQLKSLAHYIFYPAFILAAIREFLCGWYSSSYRGLGEAKA